MRDYTIIENIKIIVWGKGKIQKDFEFIFNDLKISSYITDKNSDFVDDSIITFSELDQEDKENCIIIICKEKCEDEISKLLSKGWEYKKNIFSVKDYIACIDYPVYNRTENKDVIIWGAGDVAKKFIPSFEFMYSDLKICFIVDNDVERDGEVFCGKEVISPNKIETFDNYFIIIAVAKINFLEVCEQLRNYNIHENSFVYCDYLINKPSLMLAKTLFCENVFNEKCGRMDNGIRIYNTGDIVPCCLAYKAIYGNILLEDFGNVWNSIDAKICRLSLINRTFTFCNTDNCIYLKCKSKRNYNNEDYNEVYNYSFLKEPESIETDLDSSCNLYCETCRQEIIIDKNDTYYKRYIERIKKIVGIPSRLLLNARGEVLASDYCKDIINTKQRVDKGTISILTNGLLFNRRNFELLFSQYRSIEVSVSIDAVTLETYNKLRRGGRFDILCENLRYMSNLRQENKISWFQINMCIQKQNIEEMKSFINFGKELHVDDVHLSTVQNWNTYSPEEYENISCFTRTEIKEDYKKFFTEDIVNDEIVSWTDISNYLNVPVRYTHMT